MVKLDDLEDELRLRGFSEKTLKSYIFHNTAFLAWLQKQGKLQSQQTLMGKEGVQLKNVKGSDVKSYLSHLLKNRKYEQSSLNTVVSALKFYFEETKG